MAWIVGDGFDCYAAPADWLRSGIWDSTPATIGIGVPSNPIPPRWSPGQCAVIGANIYGIKNIGSNESTLFGLCAYYRDTALSGTVAEGYLQYLDAGTIQCTVVFESSGNIVLKRGSYNGTVVATYTGAFPADMWTHFQTRVVLHATAGTFTVRKNGSLTDSFTATGLNTISTANAYANTVQFGNASGTRRFDDVCFYSGSGGAPNTWVGDVRAMLLTASQDTAQKNFAASAVTIQQGDNTLLTLTTPTGTLRLGGIQSTSLGGPGALFPARSGSITSVVVANQAAITGHCQVALYNADGPGGQPGTLVAASNVLTNPASGAITFTFPGTPFISAWKGYYFGFLSDVSWNVASIGTTNSNWTTPVTYASGFPATLPVVLTADTANRGPQAFVNLSGNVVSVSEAQENSDTDYIQSSTPGDMDLYQMATLPAQTSVVLAVVSRVWLKKTDAGARQGQMLVKSGATTVTSPDSVLSTTYGYVVHVDPVDPNTGAPWTVAAVNALQVGVKVTS
jgi:hypothetical protein